MLIQEKTWIPQKLRRAYNSELKDWLVSSSSSLPLKVKCFCELVRRRIFRLDRAGRDSLKDDMDIKFDKGLVYLTEEDHVNIKKSIHFYLMQKEHKDDKQWNDMLNLYGDLNVSDKTKEIDKEWL